MSRHAKRQWESSDRAWRGQRRKYDLVKEVMISGAIVGILVIVLAVVFASPDPPSLTFKEWVHTAPHDFLSTTVTEVNQTSLSATYGPPYQTTAQNGSTQGFGPLSPEKWFGQRIPVNSLQDYVAKPLNTLPDPTAANKALAEWSAASSDQQTAWAKAFTDALGKATFKGGAYDVDNTGSGPLGTILQAQYGLAMSGGLDNAIVANPEARLWYSNDQTFALLYMGDSGQGGGADACTGPGQTPSGADGCWYYNQANGNTKPRYGGYLDGGSWGVVNEVGNWPGAWWLFPYSFWYQWGYGANGASADLYAMIMTGLVSMLVIFLPWIPGLRDIPRGARLYKLMWRDYYELVKLGPPPPPRQVTISATTAATSESTAKP